MGIPEGGGLNGGGLQTMRFRCVPTSVHPYRREGTLLTFFRRGPSLSVHDTGMPEGGRTQWRRAANHALQVRTYICTIRTDVRVRHSHFFSEAKPVCT